MVTIVGMSMPVTMLEAVVFGRDFEMTGHCPHKSKWSEEHQNDLLNLARG